MEYVKAFFVGGVFCVIGQILIDKTKLTPARILVSYVTSGVLLSGIGVYQPLADWAGAGATVPLTGFGHLLAKGVKKAVAEQGLDIPIYVDSFIVFSAPKGQHIQIDDRYRKEKHCFRTGLNHKIENYLGCAYYKAEQLTHLGSIFSEMETNAKRFKTELDYDEVRRNLAEALAILQNAVIEEQTQPVAEPTNATVIEFTPKAKRSAHKKDGIGVAIASIVTRVILSGASIWVAANGNRA